MTVISRYMKKESTKSIHPDHRSDITKKEK